MVFKNSTAGHFEVVVADDGVEVNLVFKSTKPVSLIGGNGKPDRLYYYSFPRNKVNGYIKNGTLIEQVSDEGWFDHQWGYTGDLLTKTGWNWFGLQLEDGKELLINEFRSIKTGNTFFPMANLIGPTGQLKFTRHLHLHPLKYWQSPLTKSVYPLEWAVSIPGFEMKVNISAVFPEQEMPIIGPLKSIWEGACSVLVNETKVSHRSGSISEKGFMELVGYANDHC